jgi:hypothetical protein
MKYIYLYYYRLMLCIIQESKRNARRNSLEKVGSLPVD